MILGINRTSAILLALLLGALLPAVHAWAGAMPWLVMVMLFPVFLEFNGSQANLQPSHGWLLLANIGMALAGWAVGGLIGGREVALAGFFCGLSPTATAAPVIMSFLGGQVGYVITGFILTNLVMASLAPLLLPLVISSAAHISALHVLGSVTLVMFVPLVCARLVRWFVPASAAWPGKVRNASFLLWTFLILLVSANASHYLRSQAELPLRPLGGILLISFVVCVANFALGALIGRPRFAREASQTLGQKNTSFTIYLAMAHASPLAALGPTFYVVWHNLWNSWRLHHIPAKSDPRSPPGQGR